MDLEWMGKAFLKSMKDSLSIFDQKARILYANLACRESHDPR
jgi:hypothetical protein